MEWAKGNLQDFTIRLEEITNIFVDKIEGKSPMIYFCAKVDDKMYCYRNESLAQNAKNDIEHSIEYFSNHKKDLIYKGDKYYVTDKFNCYRYLDGDFIIAFYVELEDTPNKLIKEYYKRQIENYLLYIVPLIYFNKDLYPEFLIESQIYAVTKTLIEEKISYDNLCKLGCERTKKASYFTVIEQLSIMTYEGEHLKNKCIIFAHGLDGDIQISNSIDFREVKKVRKLLETTYIKGNGDFLGLLCDTNSMKINGLISNNNCPRNYTMISFQDKGKWTMVCDDSELDIIDSSVHFSNRNIKKDKFIEELVKEEFNIENADNIVDLVEKATLQKHGTMIVISDCAEQEIERLSNTGYIVKYNKNENKYVEQITAIDGSVLVNTNGEILGIGVILDGESSNECDINNSRGARYNSAIKYTYARSKKKERCIAVVISEDGDINIIINGREKYINTTN